MFGGLSFRTHVIVRSQNAGPTGSTKESGDQIPVRRVDRDRQLRHGAKARWTEIGLDAMRQAVTGDKGTEFGSSAARTAGSK